ncbi:hypothetical protein ACFL6U_11540 [Planctomycetota bacterium]
MSKKKKKATKKASKQALSPSELAEGIQLLEAKFTKQLDNEKLIAGLKEVQKSHTKPARKKTDDEILTEMHRQDARESRWQEKCDLLRLHLESLLEHKRHDPDSELFQTIKELSYTLDRLEMDRESVDRVEYRIFRTGCHRCKVLVQAELEREAGQGGKPAPKNEGNAKNSDKKHKPWQDPPDGTGFILLQKTNARLYFSLEGKHKDLCLGSNAHALSLMTRLSHGSIRSSEVETLLNPNSKASKLIKRANEALNNRIAMKGFIGVPINTEFIGCKNGAYYSIFPIVRAGSLEELEMAHHKIEQKIVNAKRKDDRNMDYLNNDDELND